MAGASIILVRNKHLASRRGNLRALQKLDDKIQSL